MVHFKCFRSPKAKLLGFKELNEPLTIHHFYRNHSFPISLLFSVRTKPAGCNQNSFVRPSHDSVAKIADLCATDGVPNFLALKQDLHRHKRVQTKNAPAIDPAIMALARNHDPLKPVFVQKSFTQFFESVGRQSLKYGKQLILFCLLGGFRGNVNRGPSRSSSGFLSTLGVNLNPL